MCDSQSTRSGGIGHARIVGDELEAGIVNRQCRRKVDRVKGPHTWRIEAGCAIENRGGDLEEVNRLEHLRDSLEEAPVRRAARSAAAFELGEPRGDQSVALRQVGLERGGFVLPRDQFQQRRRVDAGDAAHCVR